MTPFDIISHFCSNLLNLKTDTHETKLIPIFIDFLEKNYQNIYNKFIVHFQYKEFEDKEEERVYNSHITSEYRKLLEGDFQSLLQYFTRQFYSFTEKNTCNICGACNNTVSYIHEPIASFDFVPIVGINNNLDMAGCTSEPILTCRKCCIRIMKRVLETCEIEKRTCIVYGTKQEG